MTMGWRRCRRWGQVVGTGGGETTGGGGHEGRGGGGLGGAGTGGMLANVGGGTIVHKKLTVLILKTGPSCKVSVLLINK